MPCRCATTAPSSPVLAFATPKPLSCRWFVDLLDVIRSAPGRIAIALTHRKFRLVWMGALTSSIGTWMQKVSQARLIVTMTGPDPHSLWAAH
jgi:hypothetical protein